MGGFGSNGGNVSWNIFLKKEIMYVLPTIWNFFSRMLTNQKLFWKSKKVCKRKPKDLKKTLITLIILCNDLSFFYFKFFWKKKTFFPKIFSFVIIFFVSVLWILFFIIYTYHFSLFYQLYNDLTKIFPFILYT